MHPHHTHTTMFLADVQRPGVASGAFNFYAVGDMHRDRREFDEKRFRRYIDHIAADPRAVAIVVGDLLDGRIPGRKYFDMDAVREDFLVSMRNPGYVNHGLAHLERDFRPLIKAGVPTIFVSGNHDEYLEEIGLTAELVKRLGGSAQYLGGEGFVRVRTGRASNLYTTVIHATHGSGGGKKPGSKVNNLQATFEWVDADIVVAGHVHDSDCRIIPAYGVQRTGALQLTESPRIMLRAPAFTKRAITGVVGYAGRKGYPTNDEGLLYVAINPQEGKAHRVEVPL